MSEQSEREYEKALIFNKVDETIENCHKLLDLHNLKYGKIPNIAITYSNTLLFLEQEFRRAGINFYDNNQCESSFIIDFQLQSIIITATSYLNFVVLTLTVSKEQVDEFVASYKKPSFFNHFFKGVTYNPQKTFLTSEQKQKAISFLDKYVECDNTIYNFNLKNMDLAIEFYKSCALKNGVSKTDFNARVEKIHSELSLLGYDI